MACTTPTIIAQISAKYDELQARVASADSDAAYYQEFAKEARADAVAADKQAQAVSQALAILTEAGVEL